MDAVTLWFVTGSQHLYGPETLRQVADHAGQVAKGLDASPEIPVKVIAKPVMTDPAAIRHLCREAEADPNCAGLILWMHTFSPAKMWIGGLHGFRKPLAHLHTQFHRELPWSSIDMNFMNLHQAAHGDREAGHLHTRLGLAREVVVGHWSDARVQGQLGDWARAATAWHDWQGARFARFGDNMREVSVTDGDKVSAETTFGFSVNGYGVGDLVARMNDVTDAEVDQLCAVYEATYAVTASLRRGGAQHASLREGARIELALRGFLVEGGFRGFTTTFEDLHGLPQLPGLAVQRLMADGYGFGAEGDWKMAALLRWSKVAAKGLPGGTSFMEDYTYHLPEGETAQVLGAHMLEICPSIADGQPRLEVHPLGIGGKADPVRLVFDAGTGPAINVSLVDLGHRFRLIVSEVDAVRPAQPLPNLPVARALWTVRPNFETGVAAWIYAGGAHHTVYSTQLTTRHFRDLAEVAGIECLVIDADTRLNQFRDALRWNEAAYRR